MEIEVTVDGVPLTVEYSFEGRYFPETREEPEEYPDVKIKRVCVGDSFINIKGLLSEDQEEVIVDLIYKNGYE